MIRTEILTNQETLSYKYAQIKTELSIQILEGKLSPHEKIPSLNQMTEQYGVSKITARRVLNDLVAEGLAYTVRGKGSFVADLSSYPHVEKRSANRNIGVVLLHASDVFMSEIIQGIDEETFDLGAHINLCLSNDSYEREAEILNRLVEQGIKRILLFMVLSDDETMLNPNLTLYLNLQQQGVRILLIDCYLPDVLLPSVSWDNYGGLKNLVQYVHNQGCRKLAYVTRVNNASSIAKRLEGFKDGLLEQNLHYDPRRLLRIPKGMGESLPENTCKIVADFLRHTPDVEAILCSDEEIAAGVFQAVQQASGCDLSRVRVGGFGNPKTVYLQGGHPYILLEQDTYRLGRIAGEMILRDPGLNPNGSGFALRKALSAPIRQLP